jgi:hypothetical protein
MGAEMQGYESGGLTPFLGGLTPFLGVIALDLIPCLRASFGTKCEGISSQT